MTPVIMQCIIRLSSRILAVMLCAIIVGVEGQVACPCDCSKAPKVACPCSCTCPAGEQVCEPHDAMLSVPLAHPILSRRTLVNPVSHAGGRQGQHNIMHVVSAWHLQRRDRSMCCMSRWLYNEQKHWPDILHLQFWFCPGHGSDNWLCYQTIAMQRFYITVTAPTDYTNIHRGIHCYRNTKNHSYNLYATQT